MKLAPGGREKFDKPYLVPFTGHFASFGGTFCRASPSGFPLAIPDCSILFTVLRAKPIFRKWSRTRK
jgi:hypothetical protein